MADLTPNVNVDAELARAIQQHHIHEVECVVPDITGIARGIGDRDNPA